MESCGENVAVQAELETDTARQTFHEMDSDSESNSEEQDSFARPITGNGKFMYVDVSLVASQPNTHDETDLDIFRSVTLHETYSDNQCLMDKNAFRRGVLPEDRPAMKGGFVIKTKPEPDSKIAADTLAAKIMTKVTEMDETADILAISATEPDEETGSVKGKKTKVKVKLGADGERERFPCPACGVTFVHSSDLKRHTRIHTGERPFTCSDCEATFNRADHLKYHMTKHTGVKPVSKQFTCKDCDTTFTRKNDLKRHALRKHSFGEPYPFVCTECDARFVTISELKKHKRVHTGEKPFSCSVCDATFNQSSHLKSHMTKHTGEKPFACERCSAAFRWSCLLKNHIMKTHL